MAISALCAASRSSHSLIFSWAALAWSLAGKSVMTFRNSARAWIVFYGSRPIFSFFL